MLPPRTHECNALDMQSMSRMNWEKFGAAPEHMLDWSCALVLEHLKRSALLIDATSLSNILVNVDPVRLPHAFCAFM
jgi:hypothetical protein